jgi:hypothetical protein
MTGLDPIAPIDPITKLALPITRVGNLKLFEYLGNGNDEPLDSKSDLYTNPTASALRAALVATANLEQSSAIFWTSQGLHVLGGAIINKNSAVPRKNGWTLPPRNAVYLFKAIGSAPNITGFEDTRTTDTHTPPSAVYIQCFNWVGATNQPDITPQPVQGFIPPDGSPLTQNYYCGFGDLSSPGGKPTEGCSVTDPNADCGDIPFAKTGDLLGKICDTTDTASMLKKSSGALFTGDKLYGGCQGPAQ